MQADIITSHWFRRIGEILVPLLAWGIIMMPLWLSPFHPAVVAYFIIAFDLYFLYKSVLTAYYATLSYTLINRFRTVDFAKLLQTLDNANDIQHFLVIPNYKEPLYKINETIQAVVDQDYPFDNVYLVLGFEKREKEVEKKAEKIQQRWNGRFKDILFTYHELKDNEVPGKASNQTYAVREVEEYCNARKFDLKNVMITISDADSSFDPNYLSYLTFEFLNDPDRQHHFYWAPVLLYNNFWQLPFFVRMQATLSSLLRLAFLSQTKHLIHISTYSTNLWLLKSVGYWDVDIIPEDWHIYFQAFFKYGERVKTVPLYTIINGDAVYSGGVLKTLRNRYEQEKRWAWGVTDIAYFWNNMFTTPHIKMATKLRKLFFLMETHLLWPTSFFILTISGFIPPLVNPTFKRTVMGFLLPRLTGFILTLSTVLLVLYVYLDIQTRKKLKVKTSLMQLPFMIVQWYLLPVVSFVLSALPSLDAHTRLLFGKKIKYKVTEKV